MLIGSKAQARTKLALLGAGVSGIGLATAVWAQEAPAVSASEASAASVDDVVVTGSRIVRDGFQAPTPVTVVAAEELLLASPNSLTEALNQVPQFAGSRGQAGNGSSLTASGYSATGAFLNLRNIGVNRVLVLLDGRRVPPTTYQGIVDTNTLPQALVQRVDVVTAGASAAYGSDAVSGVVNFVLDHKFEGLKGVIQAGQSSYEDSESFRASIAGGRSFLDGRGHVVFSAERYSNDGIPRKDSRPWYTPRYFAAGSGTAADPYRRVENVMATATTYGGVIRTVTGAGGAAQPNSPLLDLQFLPGGGYRPFVYGQPTGNLTHFIGGDGVLGSPHASGSAAIETDTAFLHARYDFSPSVTGFVQASWAQAQNSYTLFPDSRVGAFSGVRIFSGNAYLPAGVQNLMGSTGADSFVLSRYNTDFGDMLFSTGTYTGNITVGFEGTLGDWRWGAHYVHGQARERSANRQARNRLFLASLDAVRAPSGEIVCRATLTHPNLFPGCVPVNIFGEGSTSDAALNYFMDMSRYQSINRMDSWAANIGGEPFSTWAGDVSVDLGVEVRRQTMELESNSDWANPVDYTGVRGATASTRPFGLTNVGAAGGAVEVVEAYGEVIVPLLRDQSFAQNLDFNGAARFTDYSTSGGVWTWKAGMTWEVNDDLTFRGTQSRDIRAPTLHDLFAGEQAGGGQLFDPHTRVQAALLTLNSGNPDLKPEIANTTSFGVVFRPSSLPGFGMSLDYYDIDIQDAITTLTTTDILASCEASGGTDPSCGLIVRPLPFSDRTPSNFPSSIRVAPINMASVNVKGFDFEIGYRTDLGDHGLAGRLDARALFSYVDSYRIDPGTGGRAYETAGIDGHPGTEGVPNLRGVFSLNYENGPLTLLAQARYIGATERDNAGYRGLVYQNNDIDSVTYLDFTATYELVANGREFSPFVSIRNVLNEDPPVLESNWQGGHIFPTNTGLYDVVGRQYTVGVRFNF